MFNSKCLSGRGGGSGDCESWAVCRTELLSLPGEVIRLISEERSRDVSVGWCRQQVVLTGKGPPSQCRLGLCLEARRDGRGVRNLFSLTDTRSVRPEGCLCIGREARKADRSWRGLFGARPGGHLQEVGVCDDMAFTRC